MHILFLNAYFVPETTSFTHLDNDLLHGIINAGHKVTIICPIPTRGLTEEEYQKYKNIRQEEFFDGRIVVKRFPLPREKHNPFVRAFRYFLGNIRTRRYALKETSCDLIYCYSTPPTQGWIAGKVRRHLEKKTGRKIPLVYAVQDLFPDSLVNAGLAKKNGLLWKIGSHIERKTYASAEKIITISPTLKEILLQRNVEENKIRVISNWIDPDAVVPVSKEENKLAKELEIDTSKFIVLYAGNFGESQGTDILFETARLLCDQPQIQFVFFGGGSCFENAVMRAESCPNIRIFGLQPQERISEVYSMGDVALITCKAGVGNAGFPSKTWSIMACNTPIIASFDTQSDLARLLSDAHVGECVRPEDAGALSEKILEFFHNRDSLSYKNGREYIVQSACAKICVGKYLSTFAEASENPVEKSAEEKSKKEIKNEKETVL